MEGAKVITRSLRDISKLHHIAQQDTSTDLPAIRREPTTDKHRACSGPMRQLVYHPLPADLSPELETGYAFRLQWEIGEAVLKCVDITHALPTSIYLSEARLEQMHLIRYVTYSHRTESGWRVIPLVGRDIPDNLVVCIVENV